MGDELYAELTLRVREDIDAFIIESIEPFCKKVTRANILPKKAIETALLTYSKEHSDEWDAMLKECYEEHE